MRSEGEDDRALLARHAAGDRQAFGELVHRHQDRLWRVALRTLGNPDDAADALQDGLLSAYRAAAGYRGDAAVTTWLHRIVVNACLDLVRKRTSRPPAAGAADSDAPEVSDPAAGAVYDVRDTAAAVLAGLRQIPAEQAAAVVLVDIEGFSVREAAEILAVPEGTVKSRCARARARLADLLSDLGPDRATTGNAQGDVPVQRHDPPQSADGGRSR